VSERIMHDAWVSVSPAALCHNVGAVRSLLGPGTESAKPPVLIAVVKANAFGHGAVETARTLQSAGVDFFAVTTPDEALELRDGGIGARILVFLPPLPEQTPGLVDADLDITVCDEPGLRQIMQAARGRQEPVNVHLKVDTGMGRLGVLPDAALPLARLIAGEPTLTFAGIYTHFAHALERDETATRRQFAVFEQVIDRLRNEGIDAGLRHCANSAALVRFPEMRLDAVRPGTILYGQYPSAAVPRALKLQETWRLQARIVSLRDVPRGTSVGYGGEFVTRRPTRLATLPIGYADGFTLAPASATAGWRGVRSLVQGMIKRGPSLAVTVRGQKAPVIGRVAMQISALDVSDVPGVQVGDIVTVPARRLMTSARLPRVFED